MKYSRAPQNNANPNDLAGYAALREGAAIVDRPERRIFRLSGKDPVGMLNAVLTNDVPARETAAPTPCSSTRKDASRPTCAS